MDLAQFAVLAALSVLGAMVQAATGFGFSAVVAPFFLLVLESGAAIQILAVANFALSAVLVPRVWRAAPRGLLVRLLIGSALAFPAGLALFLAADILSLKRAVGLVVMLFALILLAREFGLFAEPSGEGAGRHPAVEIGVGGVAGVMGVALAFFAPAIIFYMLLVRMDKEASRATMLTYFGVTYGLATMVHGLWGGMTGTSWVMALGLLPFVFLGTYAGHRAAPRLSDRRFRAIILVTLVVSGVYAVWTSFG